MKPSLTPDEAARVRQLKRYARAVAGTDPKTLRLLGAVRDAARAVVDAELHADRAALACVTTWRVLDRHIAATDRKRRRRSGR